MGIAPVNPQETFDDIAERMVLQHPDVSRGKMMSSPGIQYKAKNFAFLWNDHMVFKLGKGYDPETIGISDWEWLNPLKNRGPMKAWFRVTPGDLDKWGELSELARAYLKKEIG